MITFDSWVEHFEANADRHRRTDALIDWTVPSALDDRTRRAIAHSFQRFELGESGDGSHLLSMAEAAGDPTYTRALSLLVAEEQKHSALFARGLEYLDAPTIDSHWTDGVFTALRRLIGLRTEIGLFLIAESVAMGYFVALAEQAPDPVIRSIGRRIADDERNHIRFQIDRLGVGFDGISAPGRLAIGLAWGVVAAGAATVLVVDHRAALHACGVRPAAYWVQAMKSFTIAAKSALAGTKAGFELAGPEAGTIAKFAQS